MSQEIIFPEDLRMTFSFNGKVTYKNIPAGNVSFEVYNIASGESEMIKEGATDNKGIYKIEFPVSTDSLNSNYIILIKKDGFVTKFITLNTYVPEENRPKLSIAEDYDLDIVMYEKKENISALKRASVMISWNYHRNQFYYDEKYYQIIAKQEQLYDADPKKYSELISSVTDTAESPVIINGSAILLDKRPVEASSETLSGNKKKESENSKLFEDPDPENNELSKMEKSKAEIQLANKNRDAKQEKLASLDKNIRNEQLKYQKKESTSLLTDTEQIIALLAFEREEEKTKTVLHEKQRQKQKEINSNKNKKYSETGPMNYLQKVMQRK